MINLSGDTKKEVTTEEKARREESKKIRNSLKIKIGTYNSGDAIQDLVKLADDIRSKMRYYSEEDSRFDSGKFYKALYKALTGTDVSEMGDEEEINMNMNDYYFKHVDITKYGLSENEGIVPYGFYWDTFDLSPLRCYIDSYNCNRILGFVRNNDTVDKLCELARVSKEYDEVLFLLCLYQIVSLKYVIYKTGRVDFVSSRIANLHNEELDYGTDGYKRVFLFEGAAYWYTSSICMVALKDNASLEKYMADFICALKMIKDPAAFSTNLYLSKGFTIGRDVDFSGLDLDTSSMLCLVCGYYDYIVSSECDNSLAELFAEKIKDLLLYGYDCSGMKRIVGMNQYEDEVVCFIPSFVICVVEEYTNKKVIPFNNG